MFARLLPNDLIDCAFAEAGPLARELADGIQSTLDGSTQYFGLRELWRKARIGFPVAYETQVTESLQAVRQGNDAPWVKAPGTRGGSLEGLSLVDERQALQDVLIAHVVQTIEDECRSELHQLGNFFAAVQGLARARGRDNPLRPALYAHALHRALIVSPLGPEACNEVMRAAALPLAQALHGFYTQACAVLRSANLSDMVASHGQGEAELRVQRRVAMQRASHHGTLDGLSRRVDEVNSRPLPLPPAGTPVSSSMPLVSVAGPNMLSRLYDQILADPRLLPPLKALLARLQIAVVRLSRSDPALLRRLDHPTWELLNRVAAHGMAFERADDERLTDFLRFMDTEAQALIDTPTPTAALFRQVLERVEAHIGQQARASSQAHSGELAALERERLRDDWRDLVRQQIDTQTVDAPLGPRMRRFLQTSWVSVIVTAMVRHGRDSQEALATIELVDALLDSLVQPRDAAEREALRMRLPILIERLHAGCESIQLPAQRRDPALNELMGQHARLLRGLPALDPAERRAAMPRSPVNGGAADDIVRQLMEERDSQLPSRWMYTEVDRGALPTVPTQLYSEPESPESRAALQRWIDELKLGHWYHLFVQGDWHTAQIAWIGEDRQHVLFVGREADARLSLTRGALQALLAAGLITSLSEDSVVQRAVDTLMNDLDGSV